MKTQNEISPKLGHPSLILYRCGLAMLLGLGFGIASVIHWGQKEDIGVREPFMLMVGPTADLFGGLLVGVIYMCVGSFVHWLLREKPPRKIITTDLVLFLGGVLYFFWQGFSR